MESLTSTVWTRLVTDFDPDEETANFGTRLALHDREGAVYDVVTWATVEPNVSKSVMAMAMGRKGL